MEALKIKKAIVILKKESINSNTFLLLNNIQCTRSRIVQSPERIRRNIASMGATAIKDKKMLAMHEAKARDHPLGCVELYRTAPVIRKRSSAPRRSLKGLADIKDSLDFEKIERIELQMKKEACPLLFFWLLHYLSEYTGNLQTPKKSSIGLRGMQKGNAKQASRPSNDFNTNMSKWILNNGLRKNALTHALHL